MVKIPTPVAQALRILRDNGIRAEIFPIYGMVHIHFMIALPDVKIEEINENPEPEHVEKSGS